MKHYHRNFYPKLVHGICTICCIPCVCPLRNSILDQPWTPSVPAQQQPHYKLVKYFAYCTVFGSFNSWNNIQLSHKATYSEEIDKTDQVVLDGISENMVALVITGKYDDINITDTTKMGYYVINPFQKPTHYKKWSCG